MKTPEEHSVPQRVVICVYTSEPCPPSCPLFEEMRDITTGSPREIARRHFSISPKQHKTRRDVCQNNKP